MEGFFLKLETLINQHYDKLNDNDNHILSYVIQNKKACAGMTINELAEATLTSKSSILRLTQKIGFSGYSEFKYALRDDIREEPDRIHSSSFMEMQESDLKQTKKHLSRSNMTEILEKIDTAETIYCYGTGWGQRTVLEDFIRSFIALERFPVLIQSMKEWEIAAKNSIIEKDLMIIVSLSGDIEKAEKLTHYLNLKNVPILSITNLSNNQLASLATYNLYYQTTPLKHEGEELFSFLPVYLTMDSLYRQYFDYIREKGKKVT